MKAVEAQMMWERFLQDCGVQVTQTAVCHAVEVTVKRMRKWLSPSSREKKKEGKNEMEDNSSCFLRPKKKVKE